MGYQHLVGKHRTSMLGEKKNERSSHYSLNYSLQTLPFEASPSCGKRNGGF